MDWRLAYCLKTLLGQVNSLYPARSKASDGTIGDAAHAATKSEHNPNAAGVVTAVDITHDPAYGADMHKLAEALIRSEDRRIWYIIFNRRIWQDGVWVPYYGDNPHDKHLHLSAAQDSRLYDKADQWNLNEGGDMTVNEPLFRRFWSLMGLDIGPEGRQPTKAEITEAVGREVYEFLDYWMNTTPLKRQREKAALYETTVAQLQGTVASLQTSKSTTAQAGSFEPLTETVYRKVK